MTTIPTAFAVGARLIAGQLNQLVSAVLDLQAQNTPTRYSATRTGVNQVTGTYSFYTGTWAASNGYTTSGTGIAVPNAGVYAINAVTQKTAGTWSGRCLNEIQAGGVVIGRSSVSGGVSEDQSSVCAIVSLAAGTEIDLTYQQSSGAAATVTLALNIAWLGGA